MLHHATYLLTLETWIHLDFGIHAAVNSPDEIELGCRRSFIRTFCSCLTLPKRKIGATGHGIKIHLAYILGKIS